MPIFQTFEDIDYHKETYAILQKYLTDNDIKQYNKYYKEYMRWKADWLKQEKIRQQNLSIEELLKKLK